MSSKHVPIWKRPRFPWAAFGHYFLRHGLFNLAQLLAFIVLIYFCIKLPLSGYSIGVVTVLAVVMTLHLNMRLAEKVIWMALLGAFLVVEFAAIRHDRSEEHRQFSATMLRFDATRTRLENVAELSQQALQEMIGGTGPVVVKPNMPSIASNGTSPLELDNTNTDQLPVRFVTIEIKELLLPKDSPEQASEKSQRGARYIYREVVPFGYWTAGVSLPPGMYQIWTRTRANTFIERLFIRPDKTSPGGWKETYCVNSSTGQLLIGHCDF